MLQLEAVYFKNTIVKFILFIRPKTFSKAVYSYSVPKFRSLTNYLRTLAAVAITRASTSSRKTTAAVTAAVNTATYIRRRHHH